MTLGQNKSHIYTPSKHLAKLVSAISRELGIEAELVILIEG